MKFASEPAFIYQVKQFINSFSSLGLFLKSIEIVGNA